MYLSMSAAPWPQRREMTLTSSGWETSSGILIARFLPVFFEHGVHLLVCQVVVEVIVHLHGGSPAACADALDFFEGKDTVWCCLAIANAEAIFAVLKHLVAAAQHAGDVGADLHVELAVRSGMQQGVVADDVAHVEFGNLDAAGDLGDHCVVDCAGFILRIEQHGNEGGAPRRGEGDQLVEPGCQLRRKDCVWYRTHRMISRASRSATMSISSG